MATNKYRYRVTGPKGGKYLTTTRKEAEALTRHGGSIRALGQRKASKVKNPDKALKWRKSGEKYIAHHKHPGAGVLYFEVSRDAGSPWIAWTLVRNGWIIGDFNTLREAKEVAGRWLDSPIKGSPNIYGHTRNPAGRFWCVDETGAALSVWEEREDAEDAARDPAEYHDPRNIIGELRVYTTEGYRRAHGRAPKLVGSEHHSAARNPKAQTKAEMVTGLDRFTWGFIDTLLWSNTDNADEYGGEPLSDNYDVHDFTKESLKEIIEICKDFRESNEALLNAAYEATRNGESRAGHDFALTKNGHGAGFWDGDWGEYGDALTEASEAYGPDHVDVFNGKLNYYQER